MLSGKTGKQSREIRRNTWCWLGTTSPSDHHGGSSRATIWAGRTQGTIAVLVVDDTRREGEETLEIELTGADGAAIDADNNTAVGTIIDND